MWHGMIPFSPCGRIIIIVIIIIKESDHDNCVKLMGKKKASPFGKAFCKYCYQQLQPLHFRQIIIYQIIKKIIIVMELFHSISLNWCAR